MELIDGILIHLQAEKDRLRRTPLHLRPENKMTDEDDERAWKEMYRDPKKFKRFLQGYD